MDRMTEYKYRPLKGVLFTLLWYFSIWAGFLFICCPLWLFILVFPKIFLPVMSVAFSLWEMYPVALMNIIFRTKLHITGDFIDANEISVIIVNHRTRVDWNFLWAMMYYASKPRSHRLKISLKAPLRHMPSLGWVMQIANCVYLQRKWEQDEITMRKQLEYFRNIGHLFQILLFPEGTDLTKNNLQRSNEFALKHELKSYTRVLHPRTTGFAFLIDSMRNKSLNLKSVYDMTLVYSDPVPQTEMDVVRGNFPKTVYFHVDKYSINDLPQDKNELKFWLNERWQNKEKRLLNFDERKQFADSAHITDIDNPLYLAFVFWTILEILMFYLLITSTIFFWWTIFHSAVFVVLSYFSDGFQSLCVTVYEYLYRLKKIE